MYEDSYLEMQYEDRFYVEDDMNDRERAEAQFMESMEGYCDYCENTGHTFRTCAARDDEGYYADDYVDAYDPETGEYY